MATYPDGTLLKASGPEVDRMEGGQRRWIPDPSTFTCMGLNWGAIQTISDSEWNQIPKGAPYPSRADATLLQGSGPQVYVMTGCQRHLIPDPDTFNARGYNWSAIHHVSDADLTAIPEGAQIPSVHDATQGVITVHNQGGYVARCSVEYDLSGQHQSQSSGNFTAGQTYSVPIPSAATNIHVKCEEETGLAWDPWKTILDKTYPSPVLQSFTLTGTTLNPSFSEEAGSGLAKQTTFTFINDLNQPVYVAVHHLGCAGTPWRDGKPKCWDQTIQPNQGATYAPSDWVVHFTTWMTLIGDGLFCIVTIAATALTGGAAAPAAAAAVAETASAAAAGAAEGATAVAAAAVEAGDLTATEAATMVSETVGEAVTEATSAQVATFADTFTQAALNRVASFLGMDAQEFSQAVGPYIQMAQRWGSAASKVGTVIKDAVVAGVAVNTYKALENDGWALYVEVGGHGYYVSNFIVSGGNYYIPISLAISGLEVEVHNQGGYVARCSIEYDLSGQHQSQSSDNFTAGQTYALLVPPGATNIHVKCEEETGLAWAPWKTIFDKTYPGPAKLGTHKTFTLTGTTLDPTYGEEGVTEPAPPPSGQPSVPSGQVTVHNQGAYVARCSIDYDVAGQRQTQSSGNFNVGQSYSVAIPAGASNIHVVCQDQTGLVWDPWKTILDKTYSTPSQKTINLTGTTLNPGYNEQ
jgi:hypothetical protein